MGNRPLPGQSIRRRPFVSERFIGTSLAVQQTIVPSLPTPGRELKQKQISAPWQYPNSLSETLSTYKRRFGLLVLPNAQQAKNPPAPKWASHAMPTYDSCHLPKLADCG